MASLTSWTLGDMAELVAKALTQSYCEACQVVEVDRNDKYCDKCADDIATYLYAAYYDSLAQEYMEAIAAEEGWY